MWLIYFLLGLFNYFLDIFISSKPFDIYIFFFLLIPSWPSWTRWRAWGRLRQATGCLRVLLSTGCVYIYMIWRRGFSLYFFFFHHIVIIFFSFFFSWETRLRNAAALHNPKTLSVSDVQPYPRSFYSDFFFFLFFIFFSSSYLYRWDGEFHARHELVVFFFLSMYDPVGVRSTIDEIRSCMVGVKRKKYK